MSRRFVNLLVKKLSGGGRPTFSLHRIDPASLFRPTGSPKPADPAGIKEARLPPAAVSFYGRRNGWIDFMALNDDVMAADHEGRLLLYDGAVGAVRVVNPMVGSKRGSISLNLGADFFFVMTREVSRTRQVHHWQALSFKDWLWHPLKPLSFDMLDYIRHPRYDKYKLGLEQLDPFELGAYTAVRDDSEIGDWALPFSGHAHYLAEHGLWIGFSEKDEQLCAADLRQQPPAPPLRKFPLLHLWEEAPLSETWTPTATSLFPLGSGKLCIARCFRTINGEKLLPSEYGHEKAENFAVLAGVEVVEHAGTGSLQVIKHNSVCYSVGENVVRPL
ncbi:unnamed protein product [Alopecurus aequalis]